MPKLVQTDNRPQLESMLSDYVGSVGDHNSREIAKKIMNLADDFKFYLTDFHEHAELLSKTKIK